MDPLAGVGGGRGDLVPVARIRGSGACDSGRHGGRPRRGLGAGRLPEGARGAGWDLEIAAAGRAPPADWPGRGGGGGGGGGPSPRAGDAYGLGGRGASSTRGEVQPAPPREDDDG